MTENNARQNPLRYVTYFYALATIQIVLVHARMMRLENPAWISKFVGFVSHYHMVLFFFIAGVLLSYTESRHTSLWKWYKGKLVKLLSPFVILTIAAYLPKVLLEPVLHNGADLSVAYLAQILFYPRKTIWGHFWFIPVYLMVMPICFMLVKRVRKNKIAWWGGILAASILNYFSIDTGWLGIKDICEFLFYTLLGITVEPYINNALCKKVIGNWALFLFLIVAGGITRSLHTIKIIEKIHIIVMVMVYLSASMILAQYNFKWLEKIGSSNLSIYIYSWPIQAILEIVFVRFTNMDLNILFFMKAAAGLVGPLVIVWAAKKITFMSKINKYLGI